MHIHIESQTQTSTFYFRSIFVTHKHLLYMLNLSVCDKYGKTNQKCQIELLFINAELITERGTFSIADDRLRIIQSVCFY